MRRALILAALLALAPMAKAQTVADVPEMILGDPLRHCKMRSTVCNRPNAPKTGSPR